MKAVIIFVASLLVFMLIRVKSERWAASHSSIEDNLIVRKARPRRDCTPMEALLATGRSVLIDDEELLARMVPKQGADEVEVVFFRLDLSARGGWIDTVALAWRYHQLGLEPIDLVALAKVNEDDPAFADKHGNISIWKDERDRWHYIVFKKSRFGEKKREVSIGPVLETKWHDGWRFAGKRKVI